MILSISFLLVKRRIMSCGFFCLIRAPGRQMQGGSHSGQRLNVQFLSFTGVAHTHTHIHTCNCTQVHTLTKLGLEVIHPLYFTLSLAIKFPVSGNSCTNHRGTAGDRGQEWLTLVIPPPRGTPSPLTPSVRAGGVLRTAPTYSDPRRLHIHLN